MTDNDRFRLSRLESRGRRMGGPAMATAAKEAARRRRQRARFGRAAVLILVAAVAGLFISRLGRGESTANTADAPSPSTSAIPTTLAPTASSNPAPTTTTTAAPTDTLASGIQLMIDEMRADADRLAAAGKLDLSEQLHANADLLEERALAGDVSATDMRFLLNILGRAVAPASTTKFGPEGEWPCEPPLIPTDIALTGWCYIYPDESEATADIIAVGPSKVMVVHIGEVRSPELEAAMIEGLGMILADPANAPHAVALVDAARAASANAGHRTDRVVATLDPPIDVASTALSTHRQGDGYVLIVGDLTIEIP